jgi:hypothetical protein
MTSTTAGTGSSTVVERCQVCGNDDLKSILFIGYLPPVNTMPLIGTTPHEQPSYPAELLQCGNCQLVQMGLIVDPQVLFPAEYPYTSSTTRILRENFAQLYQECTADFPLAADDLIVDIGSNDGNLLSNFMDHEVQGITPEDIGKLAVAKGIPTIQDYFSHDVAEQVVATRGQARVVTATNVFAHIENVNDVLDAILLMLRDDGLFISESHYLLPLVETVQYDTIYHEHLRYYSLTSLQHLLEAHGLEIIKATRIPTHGGSVRVYAARRGAYRVQDSVGQLLAEEAEKLSGDALQHFVRRVVQSKLDLYHLLRELKGADKRIVGIGAPSRASTLINYLGLDAAIIEAVLEIKGSYKIGKYVPGTKIPVIDEGMLYDEQPDYALLLSWHIAEELAPKLKQFGYKGDFIVPLPEPRVLANTDV